MTPVRPLRAAAVIVASKPLDPADAVEGFGGERGRMLPAMIRAGQVTFIERVIIRFQLAGAAPIIVITGFENDRLERHLARMSVVCLNQSGWKESTVFDDAMLGLRYVERSCRGCEKVLLTTPLIPSVKEETLAALLDSTEAIAVPVYEGIEGLPLAIRRELISEIPLKAPGKNLADLAGWSPGQPEKIEVGDQGILTRLDGRDAIADLEFLQGEKHGLPMRVRLKLNLAR